MATLGAYKSGFAKFCVNADSAAAGKCGTNIIGQMQAGGTATPNEVVEIISMKHAEKLFGRNSILYWMADIWNCQCGFSQRLFVTPLADNPAGAAVERELTFVGPSAENKSIYFSIFGVKYAIPVLTGDTANDIALATMDEINNDISCLFTASVSGDVLTLTGDHTGTALNDFEVLFVDDLPEGVGVTQIQTVAGVGDPDIADGLASWGNCIYSCVALGHEDPVARNDLMELLDTRWGCGDILFGHAFTSKTDTVPNIVQYGAATNHPYENIIPIPTGYKYPGFLLAAAWAGRQCCSACVDPTRPVVRDNGQLICLEDTCVCGDSIFHSEEEEALYEAGVSVWGCNESGTLVIRNNRTNWKYGESGDEDITWENTESRYVVKALIEILARYYNASHSSSSLGSDGTELEELSTKTTPSLFFGDLVAYLNGEDADNATLAVSRTLLDVKDISKVITVRPNTESHLPGYGDPHRLDVIIYAKLINQLLRIATTIHANVS